MRINILIYFLLALLQIQCQQENKKTNPSKSIINKENSVLGVGVVNLEQFALENDYVFSGVRNQEFKKGLDFYSLGKYSRYSFAEVFNEPHIAIKNNGKYKIIKLDTSDIGLVTSIEIKGLVSFRNRSTLELVTNYQTSWSMSSPIAGKFHECSKTLVLFDIETEKVVFSKVFKKYFEDTHLYDSYNIDSLQDGLYSPDILENDTTKKKSTFEWSNFNYTIKENEVDFFKIDKKPTEDCS
jgi:hypothetical protein